MDFIRILKNVWRTDSRCSLERRTAKIEHVGDGNQAPMFVFSQRSNGRIHTVRLGPGLADKDAGREWWGVSCCQKTWPLGFETDRQDPWPQSLTSKPRLYSLNRVLPMNAFFPSFYPFMSSAGVHKLYVASACFFPIGALTVSLRFLLYLSGCKSSSSSSSVWCQQCWLIKAVGRQCVIHSYSWHMYYSRLNTYN